MSDDFNKIPPSPYCMYYTLGVGTPKTMAIIIFKKGPTI